MFINQITNLIIDPEDYEDPIKIGSGQYGSVFKVKKEGDNKYYALKINKEKDLSVSNYKYSLREIITLYSINHPNIMKIEGISFKKTQGPSILAEYINGKSLQKYFDADEDEKPSKNIDNNTRMKIMCGIVAGVAQLHSLNIIHRDIKPSNILLTENFSPKIIDFGFATFYKDLEKRITCCGTPYYMPPIEEYIERPTPKIDIYALGFVLYQLLLRKDPFKFILQEKISEGVRPKFDHNFNKNLKDMICKMWSLNANDRVDASTAFILLGKEEYWLPGTNKKDYMKYYRKIEKKTNIALPKEMHIMKTLAEEGNSFEQYNMYLEWKKSGEEFCKGIHYLKESAKSEYPPALYELAELVKEEDPKYAYKLMKTASKKVYPPAIYQLGVYQCNGIGCKKDSIKGSKMFEKAGKIGFVEGYIELAEMRAKGDGIEKDVSLAKEIFHMIDEESINEDNKKHYKNVRKMLKHL